MKLIFSRLSSKIVQSEIRAMTFECAKVRGINLAQGVCDLELPIPVKNGVIEAMETGINHYTRYDGLPRLREAIASKMLAYNAIKTDPDKNIIVSCGATGAFYAACLALLNPADEVIIFEPFYGYHINTLLAVGTKPVFVPLRPPDWNFEIFDLEKIVTPKTKAIVINTPSNPSGKVFSKKELEILADFAVRHDLFILTDEIYEYFVYDTNRHISIGSFKHVQDRTITISGYSKTFSITGWRIGYCVCDRKWSQMIGYVNDLVYVCGPAPLQIGVSKGIEELKKDFYNSLRDEYLSKRNKFCAVLERIGLAPFVPQGAYYCLADVSCLPGKTAKDKAMNLLKKTGVAGVPGSAFYHRGGGDHYIRFCFAKKEKELDQAIERLSNL